MLHPGIIAKESPSKVAYIMADSGRKVSFEELEKESNQGAHLFRSLGLKRGDHVDLLMENNEAFFKICWAAQRSGLYYTAISWRLQQNEVKYIIENCGAKTFIASSDQKAVAEPILTDIPEVSNCFSIGGAISGFDDWTTAISGMSIDPIDDESEGQSMLYSSGTTGYPKGVKKPLPEGTFGGMVQPNMLGMLYGASPESIYLSPAPLYHAAPLGFTMSCLRQGIAVIVMEHFEAELALEYIERYRITHSQWVPTMFVRMLKLPKEVREKYDVSSLKAAIHAAAPCPIPIKEKMIEWWGPIIYEYYAGTESNGFVQLNSEEWLSHRGSVGRPLNCKLHICGDDGMELPTGESGMVYFSGGGAFEYHNDPKKTADSRNQEGWTTLGDVGYLDQDGFLYLTDRKHFMIISGGVNIYPQEAENVLIMHPSVVDVAVFGVPNEEFGEEVKAVVQPINMLDATPELEAQLMGLCRANLAHFKCPKSIDFRESLPRHPTGKLYKRLLKDEYWAN